MVKDGYTVAGETVIDEHKNIISNDLTVGGTFSILNQSLADNLNADLLDGHHGSYYTDASNLTGVIHPILLGVGT
jgi:hypothetical protein